MNLEDYRSMLAGRMLESELQQEVTDQATQLGWMYYHTHDSRRSVAGFPDLVLVKGPRIIYVELKQQKTKTTREQEKWLNALEATGAEVYLWRPSHLLDGTIARTLGGTT